MALQVLNGQSPIIVPRHLVRNGQIDRVSMYRELVDNGLLREDETRQIEETLTRVSRRDLRAVARLREAGMIANLNNIGVTSYEFDRVTPVGEATQAMSILAALGDRDLVRFGRSSIPVPVTASQFSLDIRHRAAGQGMGQPVDLTNLEEHTRSVAEKMEDTLVNGSTDIVLNGNGLPGYTNFSARHQVSYSDVPWDEISGDPEAAITDVLAMRTALRNDGFSGPYDLYVSADYDGVLDKDYKAFGDRTLRERLLSIDGVGRIIVLPTLGAQQVLMVQMTQSVAVWASGQDITSITWDQYGGLASSWAVMNVGAPALKVSYAREPLSMGVLPVLSESSGIAHLS